MVKTRTGGGVDDGPFSGMSKTDVSGRELSLAEKQWLGQQIHSKARSVQELHKRLGIPERSLRRFAQNTKDEKLFRPRGQPALLDPVAAAEVADYVTLRRRGEKVKSASAFLAKFRQGMDNTRKRRGNHTPSPKPPDRKTVRKFKLLNNVHTSETAQQSTVPRQRAALDWRNHLVHAAALEVLTEGVAESQICNVDAVSYAIKEVNGAAVFIKGDGFTGTIERDGPAATLPFGAKVVNIISQSRHIGPQVIILANEALPKDAFTPLHLLPGFGPTSAASQHTWFTSAHTRAGTVEMWKSIFEEVIFPFFETLRINDELGVRDPALLILDGEAIVVAGLSLLGEEYLQESRISFLKGPASCSAFSNPCDSGTMHKDTKREMKSITDNQAQFANAATQAKLDEVFKVVLRGQTASNRSKMVDGVLRLMHSYQQLPLARVIEKSFVSSGITAEPGSSRDMLDRQLSLSKAAISQEDYAAMRKAFPQLVELFRNQGEIKEDQMTSLGVPLAPIPEDLADKRKTARDQRALENQLSVHLNHCESQRRAGGMVQGKLLRSERAAKTKEERQRKKMWAEQDKEGSEFMLSVAEQFAEIQEEEMAKQAQYNLQSEREAPSSLHMALPARKKRAATKKPSQVGTGKENRPNLSTNPYAKKHLNTVTKSRGISKS